MFVSLFILTVFRTTNGEDEESAYECGKHGRFEYCIDGIPGCVVGCHCHPGYYFDTDSKICEPNYKLTQDYRRHYLVEPTRLYSPVITSTIIQTTTPITSDNKAIDDKIGEITNDADGLGDWLYNQFFKTIENQVLNNTKDENMLLTRRSGNDPIDKKPSRRSHKYWRSRKKKKKKKGLKNKLLRITEDDSLFDSNSGSSSDESSGTSSSESESTEPKTKGHGHKKILVVNKRPKLPLPSFIFLPNMDTPFFPPMGLPPPPLPMYPMVPVPPMVVPPYSYPGVPHVHDDEEPTTIALSTTQTSASSVTNSPKNGHTTVEHTTATQPDVQNVAKTETPNKLNEVTTETNGAPQGNIKRTHGKHRGGPRQKLMKQFRDKMKMQNKLQNFITNQYEGLENPLLDIDVNKGFFPNPNLIPLKDETNREELPPGLRDIDFKYLSQLIHRGNLNKTKQIGHYKPLMIPAISNQMTVNQPPSSRRNNYDTLYVGHSNNFLYKKPLEEYNTFDQPTQFNIDKPLRQVVEHPFNGINYRQENNIQNRRMNVKNPEIMNNMYGKTSNMPTQDANNVHFPKRIEDTNDIYYSNLGRQIASMIRNGDREVDIEIEKINQSPSGHPDFHGNNYGSRSYWERSVRSPFEHMRSFLSEMGNLKKSNENLYSLENEVVNAASTMHPLSLHELENVVNEIDITKSKLIRKNMYHVHSEPSKTSFNVNLLPENDHYDGVFNRNHINPIPEYNSKNIYRPKKKTTKDTTLQPAVRNILLKNFRSFIPEMLNYSTMIDNEVSSNLHTTSKPTKPTIIIYKNANKPNKSVVLDKKISPIQNNYKALQINESEINLIRLKPVVFNKERITYFMNHNDQSNYLNDNKVLPIRYSSSDHQESIRQRESSSYFRPQQRHFNFFDK